MNLITLKALTYRIAERSLFDELDWTVAAGEKIALVGRNGQGKSTLLNLLAGHVHADRGSVLKASGIRVKLLSQAVPSEAQGSVYQIVAQGLGAVGEALCQYRHCLEQDQQDKLLELNALIEQHDGWTHDVTIKSVIAQLGLGAELSIAQLSGGMKRRVMLAQALVSAPDLLLLDEPTNHLDIESIEWLEMFLQLYRSAVIVVSHDRRFIQQFAQSIVEIDRGNLHVYSGDYANYLKRREQRLLEQERHEQLFDKKLNQEEQWIRQGIKARRTRNEGRVRALQQLRRVRAQRVSKTGAIKSMHLGGESSGKDVIQARDVSFAYPDKRILEAFSIHLQRGDKLGIIGPNGCGKTTLLKLLLGQLQPDSGEVVLGTRIKLAYFDQLRSQLDDRLSVMDNVAQGRSEVTVNGKSRHVASYLRDFLFKPEQLNQKIIKLSGGERNRLLLAKLFAESFNVLVMDEPTNDLDLESLELLEAMLVDFSGTLLLVSHDRVFVDNVVTSILIHQQGLGFSEFIGGYSDWLDKKNRVNEKSKTKPEKLKPKKQAVKLSYNQQRELSQLPAKIERLELEVEQLHEQMLTPDFYQQSKLAIKAVQETLAEKEQALSECYARWEELESQ